MEDLGIVDELCDLWRAVEGHRGGTCTVSCLDGSPIPVARVGRRDATANVVITAGLHASEILGCAAALECIRAAEAQPVDGVCFHVLPALDVSGVERNARQVRQDARWSTLLQLDSPRDLEHELWCTAPEARAMRAWLRDIGSIDAYLSFHAASCLSGGAFFYVQGEEGVAESVMDTLRDELGAQGVPLLERDPTPMTSRARGPGFFTLTDLGEGALAHVHENFGPRLSLISEIPVGLVAPMESAEAYRQLTRRWVGEIRADRPPPVPVRWVRPRAHVRTLVAAAMTAARCVAVRPSV